MCLFWSPSETVMSSVSEESSLCWTTIEDVVLWKDYEMTKVYCEYFQRTTLLWICRHCLLKNNFLSTNHGHIVCVSHHLFFADFDKNFLWNLRLVKNASSNEEWRKLGMEMFLRLSNCSFVCCWRMWFLVKMQEMVADLGNSCKIDNIACVSGILQEFVEVWQKGCCVNTEKRGFVKNPQKSTTNCTVVVVFFWNIFSNSFPCQIVCSVQEKCMMCIVLMWYTNNCKIGQEKMSVFLSVFSYISYFLVKLFFFVCLSSIFLSKLLLWLRITFFWVSCQHLFKILNNKFLVKMTVLTTNCFLLTLFFLLKFNIFSTILLFNNEWQDKYSNFLFEITDLPDSNNNTHRFHILLLLFYLPNH